MPDRWLRIRGGTVIDGTGRLPFPAEVVIKNNRIHAVGDDSVGGRDTAARTLRGHRRDRDDCHARSDRRALSYDLRRGHD